MFNFSYAVKVLKAELAEFLNLLCDGLKRPEAKLVFDLTYGVLKSKSCAISDICRALDEDSDLNTAECRIASAISSKHPSKKLTDALEEFSVGMSEGFVAIDESDIQKPYGRAFEALDEVQDGSREGRPIGRGGYHLIGIASIGQRKCVFPIAFRAYSTKSEGFESQQRETEKILPKAEGRGISMDRGYDGKTWIALPKGCGMWFAARARSNRKYSVPSMKNRRMDIAGIQSAVKGRFSFRFAEHDKRDPVDVKATAVRVSHKDLPDGMWLVMEFFPDEREARCYLTDRDCSSKGGCREVLKCYRLRWRIEEFFHFAKSFYGIEGIMARSLCAVNWLLLAVSIATAFLSYMCSRRSPAYWQCRSAFKSFQPNLTDEEIIKREGHIPVELFRIGNGASKILEHCAKKPTPKGRDRTRHGYIQLRLDDDIFK